MNIDWWTLGIQTVNVLVLMWLLQHFFWRPVAAMIEQRRTTTQKALADARALEARATAALADIAKTRAGFAMERDTLLAKAHAEADHAGAASLDAAKKGIAEREAGAKAALARSRADDEVAWSDRASDLAVDIAGHLAARLKGGAVEAAFLDWLVAGIAALPAKVAQSVEGATLTAVTPVAMSDADQAACRARIAAAFSVHPKIVFAADPALIEGFELHGADFVVGNSWRADLVRVRAELGHHA